MAKTRARGGTHPSHDILGSRSMKLAGKKIVLCVAGSVAAYKAIDLARLLMRHGAEITCVTSPAALKLLRAEYLKWATGNEVITKITGELEHVRIAEKNTSDMVVIYPCTANTLGKLANGIDDGPVSTVLTVALGANMPILVCPAMHASMYENMSVKRNIEFLKKRAKFFLPDMVEGKAKIPEPDRILGEILRTLGASDGPLTGKRILVTVGSTAERIDSVRSITNHSSGRLGTAIISELLRAGAKVSAIYGASLYDPPQGAATVRVSSSSEMADAICKLLSGKKFDIVVMAAAVSDYAVKKPQRGKISSGKKSIVLRLEKIPKIIDGIKKIQSGVFLVGFKAEAGVSAAALKKSAADRMKSSGADMMVANDVGSARHLKNPGSNEVFVVDKNGTVGSGYRKKERLAAFIVKEIAKRTG